MIKILLPIFFLVISLFGNDSCFNLKADFGSALTILDINDAQQVHKKKSIIKNTPAKKTISRLNRTTTTSTRVLKRLSKPTQNLKKDVKIIYLSQLSKSEKMRYKRYPMIRKQSRAKISPLSLIKSRAKSINSDIVMVERHNSRFASYYYLKDIN